MRLQIIGPLSKQDAWVLNWVQAHGPVAVCDETVLAEYAAAFRKRVHYIDKDTKVRCEAWEKKLYSLWERGYLVREKKTSLYTKNMEVWHYGIPGRDAGTLYKESEVTG